ncbi:MAG: class I SAM-dependent methyltransferase [Gammaproteobacteria bacterium]
MHTNNKMALAPRRLRKTEAFRLDIDAVRKAYRRYAGFYDLYFGPVMQKGRRAAIRQMGCRPGERILEVGVGTGLSLGLYPRSVCVTGIDVSAEMLERAHARKERLRLAHVVDLIEMDAERMQFEDHVFDKVAAIYVASVAPNPVCLVNEMRRVCKLGGQLFFLNHFQSRNRLIAGMERVLAPLSKVLGFHPDMSLEDFIEDTWLDVINQSRTNMLGYWTLITARNDGCVVDPTSLPVEDLSIQLETAVVDSEIECPRPTPAWSRNRESSNGFP